MTISTSEINQQFLKNVLWKYLDGPACNCTFLLCACNCWMTWICFSNHKLVRHESLFTFLTAEKQGTQDTCKLQPPPSAGAALAILSAGDKLFQVLGLQVVCSHAFQVHTTYHKAQGTVRYGGAGDAEIAWEEAKEERGLRALSTCNKVHFESAKRMPNHLTQNLFLHFPRPSLIPLLG